jgi:uncharacterized repeat protein (TIGR01451 family)
VRQYTTITSRQQTIRVAISLLAASLLLLALLWLLGDAPVAAAPAAELHVCPSGPPTCDYATVQAAVNAAGEGDVIKVAAGVYTDVNDYIGPAQVVFIDKSVHIRGGYTTTDGFAEPADPLANPTTLDAQGQGRVLLIGGYVSPTIEGLRITGGDAAGLGGDPWGGLGDVGGGIYVGGAPAIIRNNLIFSNTADFGAGVYLEYSGAVLRDNAIYENDGSFGGGMFLEYSGARIVDNVIRDNDGLAGGGLFLDYSDATLSGDTIISNTAEYGGGVYLEYSGATLDGNDISFNVVAGEFGSQGGGLSLYNSPITFTSNTVLYNVADSGGGLFIGGSDAVLANNVIAGNQASIGGGVEVIESLPRMLHTTFSQNSPVGVFVSDEGGGSSTVWLTNTILAYHDGGIYVTAGNTATLESTLWYSNELDWLDEGAIFTGTNNYWGDPDFVSAGDGECHIGVASNAIDRGIDAGVGEDMDGEPRPQGDAADLGADELPEFAVVKTGPSTALAGASIAYTLTVMNSGEITVTNLVITDAIPVGAYYVGGGTKVGQQVRWTVPSLAAHADVQVTFVVTAFTTIVNDDYHVSAAGGYSATGRVAVRTAIASPVSIVGLVATNDSPTPLGQATTLTATITAGSNVAYVWNFGDGMPGSGSPVIHVYPATGLYTAVVTASNPVSVVTATTTVAITGGQRLCWARLNDDPTDYTTVQAAIDASTHPTDVVKVAGYCSIVNHYGGASQVAYVDKTLTVRGGYTATNWNVSDPISYPTTLDAQGQGRVLYIVGDGYPVIEGLRLIGGDADGLGCAENPGRDCGGGIYVVGASAAIRNCEISDSTASWYGGGIYLYESSAVLDRNDVLSNTSAYFGGGVFLRSSGATLSGNTISYNVAGSQYGGGLYVSSSGEAVMVSNTVTYNDAEIDGGGLYLSASDGTMLSGNVIGSNTAQYGGGLSFSGSDAIMVNNVVVDNQTEFPGGGLHIVRSSPRMWHTTVARNSSPGIYVNNFGSGTSVVMLTNTIVANHVTGLFVASGGTTVTLQNTLWHGNTTPWSGGGTIIRSGDYTGDPVFVDPAGGDYHIGPSSAAIDAGLDAGVTADFDGDARPQGKGYDIGADELPVALEVTKQTVLGLAQPGAPLSYTISITNTGNLTLTATITDILPAPVTPSGPLTWTASIAASSGVWTKQFTVTVDSGYVGVLTNVVRVTTEEGATGTYTHTIATIPAVAFSSPSYDTSESGSVATITVTLSHASSVTVTVDYASGGGTATPGEDYSSVSNTLVFTPGVTSRAFTVPITQDGIDEYDETVNLTLSNADSATIGDNDQAALVIRDDDAPPGLSISDVTVTEGDSVSVSAVFTVTLSAVSAKIVTVEYATSDGTATAPADYTTIPTTTLTFDPGVATRWVTVTVQGDTLDEADESFFVNLTSATNASIGDDRGQGTIQDDDAPPRVSFSSTSYNVSEDVGLVNVAVALDTPSALTITVEYTAAGGMATSGEDYVIVDGTLVFTPGVVGQTITVTIIDDGVNESEETIILILHNPSNAIIEDGTAIVTIAGKAEVYLPLVLRDW